jgi:thymidylate synthase
VTYSYRYDDGSNLYLRICQELLEMKTRVTARGMPTRELRSVQVEITDPSEVHVLRTTRKPSLTIAATEAFHLIGGISSLEQLDLASGGRFTQFADNGRLRGAYGPRAHLQLLNAERLLKADPGTRQAGVTIWKGNETGIQSKDVPCTTSLHFYYRDGKLELDVTMRSNDIFLGFPIDIMMFSCLQRAMAASLGVSAGPYRHRAGSMHIYERDLDRLAFILKTGIIPEKAMAQQIPLPVPYFLLESGPRSFSFMAAKARDICLRENDDRFHDVEWQIQHIPCLGPGWDFCPLCRYVVKKDKGCTECSSPREENAALLQVPVNELRKYAGRHVAIRDGRIISDAADITGIITDLRSRGLIAQAVFRVPASWDGEK